MRRDFVRGSLKIEWLDTDEAADYLRLSVNALRIRIHRKQIMAYKLGSRLRFKKSDLDNYMRLSR
jgi:excisionase family DNA binding protein